MPNWRWNKSRSSTMAPSPRSSHGMKTANEMAASMREKMIMVDLNQSSIWPRSSTTSRQPSVMAIRRNPTQSIFMPPANARAVRVRVLPAHRPASAPAPTSDPDRHIDEEDPVPGVIVGDPAADRRADGRRDDDCDAVEGERLSRFAGGNVSARMACSLVGMPPPPSPCRMRKKISGPRFGASPHSNELTVNSATQIM